MTDAERVWLRLPGGSVQMFTLPLGEYIERQVTDGYLLRVNEDGSAYGGPFGEPSPAGAPAETAAAPETAEPERVAAEEPVRPAANAPKADWVNYAVALGVVTDPAEANAMTKRELVETLTPPEMVPPDPEE